MTKYVALLRGINVSGQKLIKMEVLRQVFADMKLKNVTTYIQSGNVLFESADTDEAALQTKIEKALLKSFGYEVPVFLRTAKEMAAIVKNNIFEPGASGKTEMLYICFLHNAPDAGQKKKLLAIANEAETYDVKKREIYCLVDKGVAKVPFSNAYIEKLIKMPATTRNWNTVNKLLKLMD